jgi:glycosyltransferase involved in cell wall biosynthesis
MDRTLEPLRGKRVALVTNIPRPYRQPLYATLQQALARQGAEFTVFFYSDQSRHARRRQTLVAAGDYPSVSAAGLEISLGYERVISLPTRFAPALWRYRPDVVLSGAFGAVGLFAWLYTNLCGIPYIQWSGVTPVRESGRLGYMIHAFLARHAEVCLSYSSVAREHLIAMGARPERVIQGVNAVDTAFFAEGCERARPDAERLKREHKLDGINLLCVSNLLPRKGLNLLIDAFSRTAHQTHLHFVGGGPAEAELRAQVEAAGLAGRVHFWGAQRPEDVPLYYALADVFVFPSLYDVWGLVLNEAMACGLPPVASTLAGATRDLVEDGVNGFAVDPRDVPALAAALQRLIGDADLRARLGAAAARTIQEKATIAHSAEAFLRAIQLALKPAR